MTRDHSRPGVTLVELLVVLVLVSMLVTIAGASTQRILAVQTRLSSADGRRTASSDALQTLTRHVASADPTLGDLRTARDTALEFVHALGSTTVCRSHGDTLVVTSGADSLPWVTTLPRLITDDDAVRVWHDDDSRWVARQVRDVSSAAGACGDSSLAWPGRATQQLILDSAATGLRPGAVVRVLQRERWSLVRGADDNWSLSLATWDPTRLRFAVPQPLLSPLATPSAMAGAGLETHALDAVGRRLPDSALARARSIVVVLRHATTGRHDIIVDSGRIDVGHR